MQQTLTHALCDDSKPQFEMALAALAPHHARYQQSPLAHMLLAQKHDDIAAMHDMATALADGAQRILLLGTGGSSLGAQVLAQVHGALTPAGKMHGPELIFVDNLDAETYARLLDTELQTSRFLVVSKSGETAETVMQLGGALMALDAQGLDAARHIGAITGPGDSALRRLGAHYGFALLDDDPQIGGRFSVLTNVGLLPAIWAGADPLAVRAGAASVVAGLSGALTDFAPAQGAAVQLAHMAVGRNISVLIPYADRLDRLSFWYRQLWAESLGKQGKGSVPVNGLGPVDQHSQVQLYLDGPDDKFYTFISRPTRGCGTSVPSHFAADDALGALAGQTMGDLVDAHARATVDVLVDAGRPVRQILLDAVSDETIGALVMHFMLETIYAADGLGVNAFDQPAVEAGKMRAKHYLAQG